MIPSSGLILIHELCIGDISDFWGMISHSNKTVSSHVTSKITLKRLSVTNCTCVDFLFCNRQNLQEKNEKCCSCYSSGDAQHAKLTLNFGPKIQLENDTIIINSLIFL